MRLRILLPKVKPEAITIPPNVPMLVVEGRSFTCESLVSKPLRDTVYQAVQVPRYQCLRCKRTFRVYPEGTSRAQTGASSQRASRDALSVGVELWSRLAGLRRTGNLSV